MDNQNLGLAGKYAQVYKILSPYISSGIRSGANFADSITKEMGRGSPKSGFYNVSFENITLEVDGREEKFRLNPMPRFIDDLLGLSFLERNWSSDVYNVTMYRVKSPESVSEKLGRRTSVENDSGLFTCPPSVYSLDYETLEALQKSRSKRIGPEVKALLKDAGKFESELRRAENEAYAQIDALQDVGLEKISPLLSDFVSEANTIYRLFHQARGSGRIDLNYWAGTTGNWSVFHNSRFLKLFGSVAFAEHCENNSNLDEMISLSYDYLKLFYETQHNLLFESPVFYIYSAIRELEYAGFGKTKSLQELAKLSVDYDIFCSDTLFDGAFTESSRGIKTAQRLFTFWEKRMACIACAQEILGSLNTSQNASDYALARRMLGLYIMRLNWTDPRAESKLYARLEKIASGYENFEPAAGYIKNRAETVKKISEVHTALFPKNSRGGIFKKRRSACLKTLEKLSSELRNQGAFIYAARADEFRENIISHSSYKLGPQKYYDIRDIFSPWPTIRSAISSSEGRNNGLGEVLARLSKTIEKPLSNFLSSLYGLADSYSSQSGEQFVDNLFFPKNNSPAHCVDKLPADAFPPEDQIKHHNKLQADLRICGRTTGVGEPNYYFVDYKDVSNLRFSFSSVDSRHNPANFPVPRPDKRAVVYGPLVYPEYFSRVRDIISDASPLESSFEYSRVRAEEARSIPMRMKKATYLLASYLSTTDYYRGCKVSCSIGNGQKNKPLAELSLQPEVLRKNEHWDIISSEPGNQMIVDSKHHYTARLETSRFPKSTGDVLASNEAAVLDTVLKDKVLSYRLELYSIGMHRVANSVLSDMAKQFMRKRKPTESKFSFEKITL